MSVRIGIVCDNNDPLNLRRVKVTSQDRGSSVSDWIQRITLYDPDDLPVPEIGASLVIASIDDDSNSDIYLGVLQTTSTNQPYKNTDKADWITRQPANWVSHTGKKALLSAVEFVVSTLSGNCVKLRTDGGVEIRNSLGSIVLLPSGYCIFTNPSGTYTFSNSGLNINTTTPINITSPSVKINGSEVARVGGSDTGGNTTIS